MSQNKKSILIVDDEKGFHDLYHYTLEPLGYEVVSAWNGIEAVNQVRDRAFDLIILDVHMPQMQGTEALAQIKQLRPDQKVVISSSSSDSSFAAEGEAKSRGAIECLFKPFGLDEIMGLIGQAVQL